MTATTTTWTTHSLAQRVQPVISSWGVQHSVAHSVAHNMAAAHAHGHASHGVQLLPRYHRWLTQLRVLNSQPEITVQHDTAAHSTTVDAQRSFGHWALPAALTAAAAAHQGAATVSVRRLGHTGYVAQCLRAAQLTQHVVLLWVNTSGSRLVQPWQGQGRWMSSTVQAAWIPGVGVMDLGLAALSENGIHHALLSGQVLKPGVLRTRAGEISTDPHSLYVRTDQGLNAAQSSTAILFDSARAYALGLIAECLAGVITGSGTGQNSSFYQGAWAVLVPVSTVQQEQLAQYAQWLTQSGARLPGSAHSDSFELTAWETELLNQWSS